MPSTLAIRQPPLRQLLWSGFACRPNLSRRRLTVLPSAKSAATSAGRSACASAATITSSDFRCTDVFFYCIESTQLKQNRQKRTRYFTLGGFERATSSRASRCLHHSAGCTAPAAAARCSRARAQAAARPTHRSTHPALSARPFASV